MTQPVNLTDGTKEIAGEWFIKNVKGGVQLKMEGDEVRSVQSCFGGQPVVGKVRKGSHFEMDVQMGGFPMIARMTSRTDQQKYLEFSNGGLWSKNQPAFEPLPAPAGVNGHVNGNVNGHVNGGKDGVLGIPMSEVKKHNTKDSAWVVLHGYIYDLTKFLEDHPGGDQVVLDWAGKDATKFWSAIHKKDWIKEYTKPEWCLGPVGKEAPNEELKKAQDEIKLLKAELERLTALPTKPSAGLVAALDAAGACKPAPALSADAPTHVSSECPSVELKGRRVLVVGHGPVGHDFAPRSASASLFSHSRCPTQQTENCSEWHPPKHIFPTPHHASGCMKQTAQDPMNTFFRSQMPEFEEV